MTDQQTTWAPGAIANGHILIEGEGWVPLTEHERRLREAHAAAALASAPQLAPQPAAGRPSSTGPTRATKRIGARAAWYRRSWAVGVAAGLVGLVLGAAVSGTADPTASAEYKSQAKELAAVQSDLENAQADLQGAQDDLATARADVVAAQDEAKSVAGDLPAREAALKDGQTQLSADQEDLSGRENAVAAKEKSVAKREEAVGIVEHEIEANTVSGDGVYEVGVDMKAGTYKSSGGSDLCYYAENGDANGDNILTNNIVSDGAPAVTTISEGHFFETSGCGDWVYQQ